MDLRELKAVERMLDKDTKSLTFFLEILDGRPIFGLILSGYDMEQEISQGINQKLITTKEGSLLKERLDKLKKSEEFREDLIQINRRWKEWIYGPELPDELSTFDDGFLKFMKWVYERPDFKPEVRDKGLKGIEEIKSLLKKHRVDAIIRGEPFVHVDIKTLESFVDNTGRTVIRCDIPVHLNVERFRKLIEREFCREKRFLSGFRRDPIKIERARWGEVSGIRFYYEKRNRRIFRKYIKLKKEGLSDEKVFYEIYREFDLEKDMSDSQSIKPIVRKYKKGKK